LVHVAGTAVTAPILGTLYLRPSPDADRFVAVGDTVAADTTVAVIEVMKLMNPVPAGVAGTVTEICAAEGSMVEYGQTLMRVEPERRP
jgi:acetyl-CoA carboxylase biotin carboxyl carrier protein